MRHSERTSGAVGPSFVIRNASSGSVRNITLEALRIEGLQQNVFGPSEGDLLTIGDSVMTGMVNNIVMTDVELIDPGAVATFRAVIRRKWEERIS